MCVLQGVAPCTRFDHSWVWLWLVVARWAAKRFCSNCVLRYSPGSPAFTRIITAFGFVLVPTFGAGQEVYSWFLELFFNWKSGCSTETVKLVLENKHNRWFFLWATPFLYICCSCKMNDLTTSMLKHWGVFLMEGNKTIGRWWLLLDRKTATLKLKWVQHGRLFGCSKEDLVAYFRYQQSHCQPGWMFVHVWRPPDNERGDLSLMLFNLPA